MALIITFGNFSKEYGARLVGTSWFYINILSEYLSEAYDLRSGDMIKGEIMEVKQPTGFSELESRQITLVLDIRVIWDRLFISMDDWKRVFRDWGFVSPGFVLKLKLTEAIRKATGESVTLYSKRDVKI